MDLQVQGGARTRAHQAQQAEQERIPCAASQRGAWVLELLQQATIPVPQLRKDALRESMRLAPTEEGLFDVFFEVVADSPFIADARKEELADAVLAGRWQTVSGLVGVARTIRPPLETTPRQAAAEFKYMAVRIFQKSRKLRNLSKARRQALGSALLSCTTREEVIEFLMRALETAQILSEQARTLIANDVLEGKYYRLLLPDRFDCDDVPRLKTNLVPSQNQGQAKQEEDSEDCIICFGPYGEQDPPTILSACGHAFCSTCIQEWATRLQSPFPCPSCRTENTLKAKTTSQQDDDDSDGESC